MDSLRGKVIIIPFYQNSISPGKGINRIEMYNLKNTENQKTFKEMTSNSTSNDLNEATNIFLKKLEENFVLRK